MSELLIQIANSHTGPQRGDVIVTSDIWGEFELTKSDWRILVCPDITDSDASVFTTQQVSTSLDSEPTPTAYRGFYLDLNSMEKSIDGFQDWLDGNARSNPKFRINETLEHYKLKRGPVTNPNVIGQSRKSIG